MDTSETTWPRSTDELAETQRRLAVASPALWRPSDDNTSILLGGCFCCHPRGLAGPGAEGDHLWAAAVVLTDRSLAAHAVVPTSAGAPYAAGLLALRDGPALEAAVRALGSWPDVLVVNATGRDHPRHAGLALHLGAVLDLPTVGVTHRPLQATGSWPPHEAGHASRLFLDGQPVAAWLRTHRNRRPVVAHAGWRTDIDVALHVVRAATVNHRTPAPLRHARRLARRARAEGPG